MKKSLQSLGKNSVQLIISCKANHGGWDEYFEEDLINYICEINSIAPVSPY